MELRVLGPVEAENGQGPIDLGPRKQRALLTLLALHAGTVVSTDRILEALWGEDAFEKENALWVLVSRLRSALEPDCERGGEGTIVLTKEPGYLLDPASVDLDLTRFGDLVDQARSLGDQDPERTAALCRDGIALWRGDLAGEFTHEDFAVPSALQAAEALLEAQEMLAGARLRLGGAREQIAHLRTLHEEHPLRDRLVELLATSLYQSGQQVDALRLLDSHRTRLDDELGIDPSPALRSLEEQILLHDPSIAPVETAPELGSTEPIEVGANPFNGLRAFGEADAHRFFGRDALVEQIASTMATKAVTAVVGASGSGKSSVVKAGVVPLVRRDGLAGAPAVVAQMLPGAHPIAELEAALIKATDVDASYVSEQLRWGDQGLVAVARMLPEGQRLVLVIDQFEELYTLVDDDQVRGHFLRLLTEATADPHGRVRVLLTLRADFYDRPLEEPDFGAIVSDGLVSVTPMTPAELEAAAERPAAAAGVRFGPSLLVDLVTDVADRPGALPLFQFTLTELYDRAVDATMTRSAYDEIGGVTGALGRHAEAVYGHLADDEQLLAEQLFLRLVTITDSETSRRRVDAAELLALDLDHIALQRVIHDFGRDRLLSFDRDEGTGKPTLEVAHEALLSAWPRLAGWIDERRADLVRLAPVRALAAEWIEADRHPDYLLTGDRLAAVEAWVEDSRLTLTADEADLLQASIERRQTIAQTEAERQRRELRRLRRLLTTTAVFLVLAVAASVFAIVQQRRADNRADDATAAAALAQARGIAAQASGLADQNPFLALGLAAESTDLVDPVPIESYEALAQARSELAGGAWTPIQPAPNTTKRRVSVIAVRPDGSEIAVGGGNPDPRLFTLDRIDLTTGLERADPITTDATSGTSADALAYSPDGQLLLAAGAREIEVFDADTGALIGRTEIDEPIRITTVEFSPDGSTFLTGGASGQVVEWDTATLAATGFMVSSPDGDAVRAVRFSSDGERVAVVGGGGDGNLVLGDIPFAGPEGFAFVVDLSGRVLWSKEFQGLGSDVAWTPDDASIAIASRPAFSLGKVLVLRASDGGESLQLQPDVSAGVSAVAISPDGSTIFAGGLGTVDAWDLETGARRDTSITDRSPAPVQQWSFQLVDDRIIAVGWNLDRVRWWSQTVRPDLGPRPAPDERAIDSVAFFGSGERAVAVGRSGVLRIVDTSSGADVAAIDAGLGRLVAVAPDRTRPQVAVLAQSGTLRLVDEAGVVAAEVDTNGEGLALAYGGRPDELVVAVDDELQLRSAVDLSLVRSVRVREVPLEPPPDRLRPPTETVTDMALSPDGELVVATLISGSVVVWRLDATEAEIVEPAHPGSLGGVEFHPDGASFFTVGSEGDITEWDARDLTPTVAANRHAGGAEDIALAIGGRVAITVGADGTVQLTDPAIGRTLGPQLVAHDLTAVAVAVDPSGQRFITGARDGSIQIWDVLIPERACELAATVSVAELRAFLGGPEPTVCAEVLAD